MGETVVSFDPGVFHANAERIRASLSEVFQTALAVEALALEAEANRDVPVASGELKSSSFTDARPTEAGNPAATVGYDLERAPAVHEGFHHGKKTKTPRRFWLQEAANRFGPGFGARMADRAKQVTGG